MHTKDDPEWPPGTVRLEDLLGSSNRNGQVILQPRPTRDPNDPLNWSTFRKYLNFGLVCFYALMIFALIDMATPTWSPMHEQLGFSYTILNDSYALGCGTLAIGAFCFIPFALKYGRRPVYIISTAGQLAVSVWSAKLETVADIMLVNAFSCGLGALAEVIVQMTVADVFFIHQRGVMNSIYVWFVSVGGSLAPVAAGYMTINQGWRWVWWWNAIFFAVCLVLFFLLYEETKYTPQTTLEGNAAALIQDPLDGADQKVRDEESKDVMTKTEPQTEASSLDDGLSHNLTSIDIDPNIPVKTYWEKLKPWSSTEGDWGEFMRHSWQPLAILFTIPGAFYMSLLYGAMTGTTCVQITTQSSWLAEPPYNFNSAQIGLMSLPGFIGTTIGALIVGPVSDWLILVLSRRNNGIYEPEMRLWVIIAFIPFVPAGLFMFGIGLANGASWPILAMGSAICAFGTTPASSLSLTYITDSYTEIVADALVSVTFFRNVISTIFVFVLTPWIAGVGMKNVYLTIGVLLTVVLLGCFAFIWYGKRWRYMSRNRYRYYASRQFGGRGGV